MLLCSKIVLAIGEICVTLPRGQIARLRGKAAARTRKAAKAPGGRTPEK